MKFNFKKLASELFEKIEDKLNELFGHEVEQETQRLEQRRRQCVESDRYNDNMVREVLPVLRTTHYALDHGLVNKQLAMQAVSNLETKLDNMERKRMETEAILNKALNSPLGKDYQIYYNTETQELLLFNASYDKFNKDKPDNGFGVPAVIAIDGHTNEPYAYSTFTEMFATNPKYLAMKQDGADYMASMLPISKKVIECEGKGTLAENTIAYINGRMDSVAQTLQNELDITRQNANMSVIDKIMPIVLDNSENMSFNIETNQVMLKPHEGKGLLLLNYSEDGLTSAYYQNPNNEITRVYDYRDSSGGFAVLDDVSYKHILSQQGFADLQAADGNYVSWTTPMQKQYSENEQVYIGDTYSLKSIGKTEPVNPVFNYRTCRSDETEQNMIALTQKYQQAANEGVKATYNPYNNTINLECNNKVVSLAFDEECKCEDVFFHEKGARMGERDIIVQNSKLVNEQALGDKDFKHITEGLDLQKDSIDKENTGKNKAKTSVEHDR